MYKRILRVAAYCRVSTDHADQLNSLMSQIKYFNEYICGNVDWVLIEVYYDEGISGTSVKKREAFNRMIADAEDGKIDLILTKEVSRFARNTIDTLSFTRRLSEKGVGVIFTSDNIDTREKDGELRLTIMASIAQEESRKISERVKWGMRRKMENGFVFGHKSVIGYRVENGVLSIVPEEAEIIKRIFSEYLHEKKGCHSIAKGLNEDGIFTAQGNAWNDTVIRCILKNDKYVGDLTQWKHYTTDFLSGKRVANNGEIPLVHIPNHHEGIIDRETWDSVQEQFTVRSNLKGDGRRYSKRSWYSGKVRCGKCDKSYNATNSAEVKTLQCANRTKKGNVIKEVANGQIIGCDNKGINEKVLAFFMGYILRHIQSSREEIVNELLEDIKVMQSEDKPYDTSSLESEVENYNAKKRKAIDLMIDELITKEDLVQQTNHYDNEIARLTEEISQSRNLTAIHQQQIEKVKAYIAEVNKTAEINAENSEIYGELLDKFVINENSTIVYLNCVPFGFEISHRIEKYGKIKKFDIFVESFEIVAA